MATLQLVYDRSQVHTLWSWSLPPHLHQTVKVIRRLSGQAFAAHIAIRGQEHSPNSCVVKIARADEVPDLEKEARFYETELVNLRGRVVPEYYGLFKGKVDNLEIACIVLEMCTGPVPREPATEEFSRLVMLAACKLHGNGIIHGDLLDGHHFVRMGRELRIVDFVNASHHRCSNGTPMLSTRSAASGCRELVELERTFGAVDATYPPSSVYSRSTAPMFMDTPSMSSLATRSSYYGKW